MTRKNAFRILGVGLFILWGALSLSLPARAQRARDMVTRYDVRTIFAGTPGIDSLQIPTEMIRGRPAGGAGQTTVWNGSGADIARDRVVAVAGVQVLGTGERVPSIILATNTGATAERTRGQFVTLEAITNATQGLAGTSALSANPGPIDLAAATLGDPIYLGLTGLPTLTQPTGAFMTQEVGTVGVVASDQIAWNLAQSEAEAHTHADQSQGSQLALSAAGTAASITADAAGRALFADNFWTSATLSAGAGGKFTTDLATAAVWQNFGAANSWSTPVIAELVADDAFTAVEVSTAGVGGKFAANALTTAGITNLVADDAFTATEFVAGAGGKFAPNALVTAGIANLFGDDSWTAIEVSTVGVGGKFAADCIANAAAWQNLGAANSWTTAVIAELLADDAMTTVEFGAGAGGKFAAGALNTAGLANLVADDAFTATEVSTVGAGGKFAANALTTAGIGNLFADDSWSTTEFAAGLGGKFAAGALNNAGVANIVADDAFTATEFGAGVGGKFAANALVNAGIVNLFGDDSWTATEFVAGVGGKFATDCVSTAAAWQNLGGANTWTTAVINELVIDDAFTTAEFAAGVGGKFAAGAVNNAGLANLVADDAFTATEFGAGAGGKFGANALVNAGIVNLFGDDSWTATEFGAGVGGKFAANSLVTAGVANLFADDAWTATEFGAGVGGKFAPNALVTAGITNLFADDSWTATEFAAGAGGKFAANALAAAGVTNLIAADAFTAANNLQVFQDGSFAADAATRALFGAGIWTATELATSSVATAEILDNTVASVDLANATSTLDVNVDTPVAVVSRTYNSASDAAQDVTIYSANSPAMEILDVWLDDDVAEGGALTMTLRDATGGLGNAISSALDCNATTIQRTTLIASNSLAANSSLVMRFSAAVGVAGGTIHVEYRRR